MTETQQDPVEHPEADSHSSESTAEPRRGGCSGCLLWGVFATIVISVFLYYTGNLNNEAHKEERSENRFPQTEKSAKQYLSGRTANDHRSGCSIRYNKSGNKLKYYDPYGNPVQEVNANWFRSERYLWKVTGYDPYMKATVTMFIIGQDAIVKGMVDIE